MLTTGGGTNLFGGMTVGLEELRAAVGGVRRMVVLSDGQATVGPADATSLARLATDARAERISVSTLGLGLEFDRNTLMAIADAGGGVYGYVNRPDGVADLFTEELEKASHLVAAGVEVNFEPAHGVELIQVFGYEAWDGKSTGRGWDALVGDVHAGESRKVVIKVRVDPSATEVGTVVVSGAGQDQQIPIGLRRSEDDSVIRASVQQPRAGKVGQVVAGSGMSSSVGYYDKGLQGQGGDELLKTVEQLEVLEAELGIDFEDEKAVLVEQKELAPSREAVDDISYRAMEYME